VLQAAGFEDWFHTKILGILWQILQIQQCYCFLFTKQVVKYKYFHSPPFSEEQFKKSP
jgi:hypothetical protein